MNYSLLDSSGRCINTLTWDGTTDWTPPPDTTLVQGQTLQIGAEYVLSGGQWVLIEQPPTPPQPKWVQFGAELATDTSVNTMIATAAATAPVLHLMLGVGLGQAAQGDPQTFSVAWSNARTAGLVTQQLADHVASLAQQYDLPSNFVAQLNN